MMNMARRMLKAKKITEYWVEAVACSIYILSRSPTKNVKGIFPLEAWSGMNTRVSHLRIFGCVAYVLVLEEMRMKLDVRSENCICVGYSEERLLNCIILSPGKKLFQNMLISLKIKHGIIKIIEQMEI